LDEATETWDEAAETSDGAFEASGEASETSEFTGKLPADPSGGPVDRNSVLPAKRAIPNAPSKPSAVSDTRVIYCGANAMHLGGNLSLRSPVFDRKGQLEPIDDTAKPQQKGQACPRPQHVVTWLPTNRRETYPWSPDTGKTSRKGATPAVPKSKAAQRPDDYAKCNELGSAKEAANPSKASPKRRIEHA
jgi:hypothetical protein